jgi:transcription elongation factor GreA
MPTHATPARRGATATGLLRALDLMLDGPAVWGAPVRSSRPGVFVVELPEPIAEPPIDHTLLRGWLERVPTLTIDGTTPTPRDLAVRLGTYWLPGETVLYIGSTARQLGGRVAALVATELGDRRPFGAAYRLRTLRDIGKLRVWWAETGAPEEYADALMTAFATGVDPASIARLLDPGLVLPFANVEAPDGRREEHGLRDYFRPDEAAAVQPGTALSGAAGGPMARPSARARAASTRAAAPRATTQRAPSTRRKAAGGPAAAAATHLTTAGMDALRVELEELTTTRRREVVARIKAARELGDLRENSDYQEARREQSFLEGRVAQVESMLRNVVIIEDVERTHVVGIGSTVRVEHDDAEETYTVVGPAEARPADLRISDTSPLGRALLGAAAGDEVIVRAPAGDRLYRVLEVL